MVAHQVAYNLLAERKRSGQLSRLDLSVGELLELTRELRREPHFVDSCLSRLPVEAGAQATAQAIGDLIRTGRLSRAQGTHLEALSDNLFGYSSRVLREAERSGADRVAILSRTLDAVGRTIIGTSRESLREIYADYQSSLRPSARSCCACLSSHRSSA